MKESLIHFTFVMSASKFIVFILTVSEQKCIKYAVMQAIAPSQNVAQFAFPASWYIVFIIFTVYSNCSLSILS